VSIPASALFVVRLALSVLLMVVAWRYGWRGVLTVMALLVLPLLWVRSRRNE
jgi:hypothetical protein